MFGPFPAPHCKLAPNFSMNCTILTLPEVSHSLYGSNVFVARQVHQNVTSLKPVGSSRLILWPSILGFVFVELVVVGGIGF